MVAPLNYASNQRVMLLTLNTNNIKVGLGSSFSLNGKTYTSFTSVNGGYINTKTGVWYR